MYTPKSFFAFLLLATHCNANQVNKTRISQSIASKTATAVTASQTAAILNATVLDCFLTLPANPLTAAGLSTPFLLKEPCSMSVGTQQAFAEAAIFDPATGGISIYHPLVINANLKPAAAPVVPTIPAGAVVGLWFGFNGGVLQLLDTSGQDANASPILKGADCINGLPGTQGDVFGQVSWCNAQAWFAAANAGVTSGKTVIPPLGVDSLGNACPTSRSFEITDACPSDNVPTQYILLPDGSTVQDTAANEAAFKNGTVINNASDEALLTNIIDPLIGCTPFVAPSLTNPGASVPALALSELQASAKQLAPFGLVPINDPDCLLTASGTTSLAKTNAYRLGVNQPIIAAGSQDGALVPYCQDMVSVAPPFLKGFQTLFTNTASPDTCVGNNLFTFLSNRYLMSLTQLTCPPTAIPFQPVVCKLDGNGAATACTITLAKSTISSTAKVISKTAASSSKASSAAVKVAASSLAATGIVSAKANSTIAATSIGSSIAATTLLKATSTLPTISALKLLTTLAPTSTALAKTKPLTTATTATTKTVIIEVITFFIFTLSLGSAPPSVLSNPGGFIVLEEIFIDLPSAAGAACTHQFNTCAALAGTAFSGTDCLAQLNSCNGVASTASATATTPATLTATATVPAVASGTSSASASAVGGVVNAAGGAVTVTVTKQGACSVVGTGGVPASTSAGLARRHLHGHSHGHLKRGLGRY